ncbi:PREDICTED: uncharacterized protein LOC109174028 [Ipomoea nil]|uniref:uncharacterized protein LOC109174028 n=1 Tax=Ipomoea nil TaxID=35883 RepID=UPI00090101A4|nr:PREDICTED: uncharacterized protein LOC109174028 [Ipomoea nil]
MAAKDLVCGGIRRRIGNGNSTLIWEHPWLQDELDPIIHTEMPHYLSGARVEGLIDQDTGTWDPHMLADIFQPSDIPRIQSIPVVPEYDDIWYWYGGPNGCYSVKSGYRRIVDFDGIVYAVAILYHLWRARNGAVWDACLPRPTKLLTIAAATMRAWKDLHHRAPSQPRATAHHPTAEQPPPTPAAPNADATETALPPPHASLPEVMHGEVMTPVKCYMDASYHRGTNAAAAGAVLLDANAATYLLSAPH